MQAMDDTVLLDGETYISSKRASVISGYARDYITFLARKSEILARQIGGHWYIVETSLRDYLKKIADYKPQVPGRESRTADPESVVSFDGKEFVSVRKGADLTGYHQDYVGQLCREGKLISRQIGNRWYIERGALLAHKKQKTALLASVQVESVGLKRATATAKSAELDADRAPVMTYTRDDGHLLPEIRQAENGYKTESRVHEIPISVHISDVRTSDIPAPRVHRPKQAKTARSASPFSLGALTTVAATIVLVIAVGYISLQRGAVYADKSITGSSYALLGIADEALDRMLGILEAVVSTELRYQRRK